MAEPQPSTEQLLAEVRLASVRGVGPLIRKRLVEAFGDAVAVLNTSPQQLSAVQGVGAALARAILEAPSNEAAAAILSEAHEANIRALTPSSGEYPAALKEIYDPPPVMYCRGEVLPQDRRAVAIVGTRRATRYGLRQAELLASGLARAGVTVVSGLARGVDGAAHRAALESGGRTLAALAGGLMRIYPPEHARLADAVAQQGALLAEAPPSMPPMSGSFPQRNRIISGLSLAVVVIEAAERSGALITARHAADQGRDVMAVPGTTDNPQARGCLRLIQEGAKLVISVEDILEELDGCAAESLMLSSAPAARESDREVLVAKEWPEPDASILSTLTREPKSIDVIVESTGEPIERVLASISRLEAGGAARRVSGVLVARA